MTFSNVLANNHLDMDRALENLGFSYLVKSQLYSWPDQGLVFPIIEERKYFELKLCSVKYLLFCYLKTRVKKASFITKIT